MTTILHLTDPHIYEDAARTRISIDTRRSFEHVLALAKSRAHKWDMVLLTGDLAENAEEESYRWLARRLKLFGLPTYAIAGNHDISALVKHYFPSPPIIDARQWNVVLLDSSVPGEAHGTLPESELRTLETQLLSATDSFHLVVLHHQPLPIGSPWMDNMGLRKSEKFWRIIDQQSNVEGIVWGHVHQNFDLYRGGVRLLATPSTCTQFMPRISRFEADPRRPGYRKIILQPDGTIDTEVQRIDG